MAETLDNYARGRRVNVMFPRNLSRSERCEWLWIKCAWAAAIIGVSAIGLTLSAWYASIWAEHVTKTVERLLYTGLVSLIPCVLLIIAAAIFWNVADAARRYGR